MLLIEKEKKHQNRLNFNFITSFYFNLNSILEYENFFINSISK